MSGPIAKLEHEKEEFRLMLAKKNEELNQAMMTIGVLQDDISRMQKESQPRPVDVSEESGLSLPDLIEARFRLLEGRLAAIEKGPGRPAVNTDEGGEKIMKKKKRKKKKNKKNSQPESEDAVEKSSPVPRPRPTAAVSQPSASKPKKKILLFGDSILKPLRVTAGEGFSIVKQAVGGLNLKTAARQLQDKGISDDIGTVLIHCGTNSLRIRRGVVINTKEVEEDFKSLITNLKKNFSGKVIVSGVLNRRDAYLGEICQINEIFDGVCASENVNFVDPNVWVGYDGLVADGLHLNFRGKSRLSSLFSRMLDYYDEKNV